LSRGSAIPVIPASLHAAHIPVHIEQLTLMRETMEQDPSQLTALFAGFMATLEHTTAHVEFISNDPFHAQESAGYRKVLQEAQEIAHNGAEEIQRGQQIAAEEAAAGGQPAPEAQVSPEVIARLEEN